MADGFNYAAVVQSLNVLQHVALGLVFLSGLLTNRGVLPSSDGWIALYVVAFIVDLVELVCVVVFARQRMGSAGAAFTHWLNMYVLVWSHWVSDAMMGILLLVYFSVDNRPASASPLLPPVLHWSSVTLAGVVAYWWLELLLYFKAIGAYVKDASAASAGLQTPAQKSARFAASRY